MAIREEDQWREGHQEADGELFRSDVEQPIEESDEQQPPLKLDVIQECDESDEDSDSDDHQPDESDIDGTLAGQRPERLNSGLTEEHSSSSSAPVITFTEALLEFLVDFEIEGYDSDAEPLMGLDLIDGYDGDDEDYQAFLMEQYEYLGRVPASQSAIQALEKRRFEEGEEELMDEACTVCLEKFLVGLDITKMPCSHYFHSNCLARWLEISDSCPLCRIKIPTN